MNTYLDNISHDMIHIIYKYLFPDAILHEVSDNLNAICDEYINNPFNIFKTTTKETSKFYIRSTPTSDYWHASFIDLDKYGIPFPSSNHPSNWRDIVLNVLNKIEDMHLIFYAEYNSEHCPYYMIVIYINIKKEYKYIIYNSYNEVDYTQNIISQSENWKDIYDIIPKRIKEELLIYNNYISKFSD